MTMPGSAALRAVNDLSSLLEIVRNPDAAKGVLDSLTEAAKRHEAAAAEARKLTDKLSGLGAEHQEREGRVQSAEKALGQRIDEHAAKVKEFNDSSAATSTQQIQRQAELTAQMNDLSAQRDAFTKAKKMYEQAKSQWETNSAKTQDDLDRQFAAIKAREAAVKEAEERLRARQDRIAKAAQDA